jgi:CTP:molybdopterin cytidylyltransferase MocA
VIFNRTLFPELKTAPLSEGAASVVRKHVHEILHLEVGDEGILIDIDTPEAYRKYVLKLAPTAPDGVTHG